MEILKRNNKEGKNMNAMKIVSVMQSIVFGIIVVAFVVTFVSHTVMALASHRWGVAVVMGLITVSSVAVIRSAIEEMKKD